MCVQHFISIILICSNTGQKLTTWTKVQPFLSVVLVCPETREQLTSWTNVYPFSSVVLSCSNTEEQLTYCRHCPANLISGADVYKFWRVTHILCTWSAWSAQTLESIEQLTFCMWSVILIGSSTEEWLTNWRHGQPLLSMGSNLLKWKATHKLESCWAILTIWKTDM